MGGLLRKDLLLLRDIGKQFAFIFIFFAVCDFFSIGQFGFCRSFGMVAVLITSINLISYDEYYHWDKYSFALPVSKHQLVQTKYIMLLGLTTFVFVLVFILELFLEENGWQAALLTIFVAYALELLAAAISLPLVYRFTARKAVLCAAGAISGLIATVAAIVGSYMKLVGEEQLIQQIDCIFENYLLLVIFGVLGLLAAVLYISYRCSVRLVEKKTF